MKRLSTSPNNLTATMLAKPFIKWAGGKGQLLEQLRQNLPPELSASPFTYVEPFVGGGAMLCFMFRRFTHIRRAVLADLRRMPLVPSR